MSEVEQALRVSLRRFANARCSHSGQCAVCDRPAAMWLRATNADGLVVAALACAEHEKDVHSALRTCSVADVAARIPRHLRARRATSATRRACRLLGVSEDQARASARLAGASSATHTYGLLAAYHQQEAKALLALARALES